jgi:alpha-D-xyloside xylohydrolase
VELRLVAGVLLTDYDEKVVGSPIDGMLERKILSVFHFDCPWMKDHHRCD